MKPIVDIPELICELIRPYCSPLMVPLNIIFVGDLVCNIAIYDGEGERTELEKEIEVYWIEETLRIRIWHWMDDESNTNYHPISFKEARRSKIETSDFYSLYYEEELDRLSSKLQPHCVNKTIKIVYYEEP